MMIESGTISQQQKAALLTRFITPKQAGLLAILVLVTSGCAQSNRVH
ncbi:hypothetical protein J4731_22140 [Providencia rettgeri]|nr:hypothetical protein [Providencia rettgeri]